jgi:uncharacterized repeat protein (TIGR02543 family)
MNKKRLSQCFLCYLLVVICSLLLITCDNPYYTFILELKTITFHTNGGGSIDDQILLKGQLIQRPSDPSKDEFAFGAWYTDNITFKEQWNFNTIPTTGKTLYAKWISAHPVTVTFDNNGGDTDADPSEITVIYNSLITPPAIAPTRAGYGFYAWYRDAANITRWNFATDRVTQDITLYARWAANYINITLIDIDNIPGALGVTFTPNVTPLITISRSGTGFPAQVSITAVGIYDSLSWRIQGVGIYAPGQPVAQNVIGTSSPILLNATNIIYNSLGQHFVTVDIVVGGTLYRTSFGFNIVQ